MKQLGGAGRNSQKTIAPTQHALFSNWGQPVPIFSLFLFCWASRVCWLGPFTGTPFLCSDIGSCLFGVNVYVCPHIFAAKAN